MPYISVIIPVYNCEKYLMDAVNSIRQQPVKDMEIILVDDGSTDSSGEICFRLAEEDTNVKVFSQTNKGASAARNTGLEHAVGEYVMFLDADDIYMIDAVDQEIVNECRKGYDVIMCSSLTANVDRDRYGVDMRMSEGVFPGGQAYPISGHFASCLYRREMLENSHVRFDEGIHLNEDEAFKMKAMYAAARIRTKAKCLYVYCITPGSVRYRDRHIYECVEGWERASEWLQQYGGAGNMVQAEAYIRQKIVSRQLLYAKLYVQQGHGEADLLQELDRIGALEELKKLPAEEMIPAQRKELKLFQEGTGKFVRWARWEGRKIWTGRMLLKLRAVRRMRDRKKFPIKIQD